MLHASERGLLLAHALHLRAERREFRWGGSGERLVRIKLDAEIDCSPEELKAIWNMPDVTPVQQEVIEVLRQQVRRQFASWPIETWSTLWDPRGRTTRNRNGEA
jgi:hypothetical protein